MIEYVIKLKKHHLLSLHASLITSVACAIMYGLHTPAGAQTEPEEPWLNPPTTKRLPVGSSTERKRVDDQGSNPFVISSDGQRLLDSVDGVYVPGQVLPGELRQIDVERQTDMALEKVDIQVKFDGLDVRPALNLRLVLPQNVYLGGEDVTFLPTSNYPDFISHAEIRIFKGHPDAALQPVLVEALGVNVNSPVPWQIPSAQEGESTFYQYVLRVYDADGRYDETAPLVLATNPAAAGKVGTLVFNAIGTGEDRTARRDIEIGGGSVTVYGRNIAPGHRVRVLGEDIPLDPEQSFVMQRILPAGEHAIDVAVLDAEGKLDASYQRDINIPDSEWFYVGLADITIGRRSGDTGIEDIRPGEYDHVYKKGRQAFYIKGKVKGEYLITAAADTDEENLSDMFRNLGKQNARQILKNLDPDDYYPVYGDDSTTLDDAPTRGKFYVRVEKGDSQVLWGNYETRIDGGTQFLRTNRSSYGASLAHKSKELTSFGARVTEATLYAAQADTLSQVDEFLGTGGSAYFLKRQNVIRGSEVVIVETRDQVTGRVLERRYLVDGEDYRFNNLQGVVILNRPLSSTTGSNAPVREGALGGNRNYLIVQYEYEPLVGDFDGYNYGGRVQHWTNEKLRLGVTALDESNGDQKHRASAVDLHYRASENTFLEAEVARSSGQAVSISRSFDGGLSISNENLRNKSGHAHAYRLEGQIDLREMELSESAGRVSGYVEKRDAGFSSQTSITNDATTLWGVAYQIALSLDTKLDLSYDHFEDTSDRRKGEGAVYLTQQLDEKTSISYGVEHMDINQPQAMRAGKTGYDGHRTDVGVRVNHSPDSLRTYHVFGQGTVHHSGTVNKNNRIGAGASLSLNDVMGLRSEVSYGSGGWGGLAGLTYDPDVNSHYYVGYELNPDRQYDLGGSRELIGRDMGNVVAGGRRRVGERTTFFVENSYDLFGVRRSLAQTYGVSYTPSDVSTVVGGLEWGRIQDDTTDPATGFERSDFRRFAPSLEYIYKNAETGVTGRVRGEARIERSEDGSRSQNTWLLASALSWKVDANWRTFLGVDAVVSDSKGDATSYADTKFIEANVGYAYRPVDNSRLSALFKYNWLYDMPGNNQVTSGGRFDTYAPAQRIHVLSADANYRLYPWLTVGGKYGVRLGHVKYRLQNASEIFEDSWQSSSAHLAVLRADLHFVKEWDFLFEARRLWMPSADTVDHGFLFAAYRHIGSNFKVGLGYNFGRFSDDLRYMYLNDRGIFINMVGKF